MSATLSADDLEGPLVGQPISGLLDLFDSGEAYVNIHTAANLEGEIRRPIQQGQLACNTSIMYVALD